MEQAVKVQIIGAPVACKEGVRDTWREVGKWVEWKLGQRFGALAQVRYFNLFDADCPALPRGAQLPVVLVNGEVLTSGGKISIPAIRRRIEAILEKTSL